MYAVSEQQVVASSYKVDGKWTEYSSEGVAEPVADLFRNARAKDDCDRTRLSFDAELGYVTDVYFDCGEEGSGQKVTCFEANTVDSTVCQDR